MTERRWLVWCDDTAVLPERHLTSDEVVADFLAYVEASEEVGEYEKVEIRQVPESEAS